MVVAADGFQVADSNPPEVKPAAVDEIASVVWVVLELPPVRVNNLLVVSQPNPLDSEVTEFAPLKNAIWPEVPETELLVTQVEHEMSPVVEFREIGLDAETATVPVALGNVQVLAAVKSAEVIVPVNELVAVDD